VRRLLPGAIFFAVLATIAFAIARLAQPGRQALEIDIYVLLIGSMAVATAVLAIREAFPPARGSGIAAALAVEPPPPVRPPDLVRTERLLTMGTSTAFDFHYRLRPILREVAEQRLADRRGLRLDAGSPEVQEALGEELWELVRPDREAPDERFRADVDREAVERAVERLESLT
jgi:hypothetical protein